MFEGFRAKGRLCGFEAVRVQGQNAMSSTGPPTALTPASSTSSRACHEVWTVCFEIVRIPFD